MRGLNAAFQRVELHTKQGGICFYCPSSIAVTGDGGDGSRLEHFHPRCAKGRRLVLACAWCDKNKGMMHGDAFARLIRAHMEDGKLSDQARSEIRIKAKAINRKLQARHIRRLESNAAD